MPERGIRALHLNNLFSVVVLAIISPSMAVTFPRLGASEAVDRGSTGHFLFSKSTEKRNRHST